MPKITIREVASLAKVSVSVASNALNDKGRVNANTRQRVKEAARTLGYVPNFSARRLRGEGGAIGVVLTDTLEALPLERFLGESLYWFHQRSYELGFKSHRIHLPSDEFSEAHLYDALNDGTIDGAIFVTPRIPQMETIFNVIERLNHLPHIFFSAAPQQPSESYVDSDGYNGAARAVQYLLGQGHRKIGYVMPADGNTQFNARDRLRGAQKSMQKAGLELSVYYTAQWQEDFTLDEIISDRVSALLTWNDVFALRIISKLNQLGHRVPDEIAIIGFDDEMFSKWTNPTITTVSQPIPEMSKAAVDYLVSKCKPGKTNPLREKFPMELILRDSA